MVIFVGCNAIYTCVIRQITCLSAQASGTYPKTWSGLTVNVVRVIH